jgi:hypothetical protein
MGAIPADQTPAGLPERGVPLLHHDPGQRADRRKPDRHSERGQSDWRAGHPGRLQRPAGKLRVAGGNAQQRRYQNRAPRGREKHRRELAYVSGSRVHLLPGLAAGNARRLLLHLQQADGYHLRRRQPLYGFRRRGLCRRRENAGGMAVRFGQRDDPRRGYGDPGRRVLPEFRPYRGCAAGRAGIHGRHGIQQLRQSDADYPAGRAENDWRRDICQHGHYRDRSAGQRAVRGIRRFFQLPADGTDGAVRLYRLLRYRVRADPRRGDGARVRGFHGGGLRRAAGGGLCLAGRDPGPAGPAGLHGRDIRSGNKDHQRPDRPCADRHPRWKNPCGHPADPIHIQRPAGHRRGLHRIQHKQHHPHRDPRGRAFRDGRLFRFCKADVRLSARLAHSADRRIFRLHGADRRHLRGRRLLLRGGRFLHR